VEGGYVRGTYPRATCPGEGEGYMPGEGGLHAQRGHVNATCPRKIGVARAKGPGREGYVPSGGWICQRDMSRGYMPGEGGLHARGGRATCPGAKCPAVRTCQCYMSREGG